MHAVGKTSQLPSDWTHQLNGSLLARGRRHKSVFIRDCQTAIFPVGFGHAFSEEELDEPAWLPFEDIRIDEEDASDSPLEEPFEDWDPEECPPWLELPPWLDAWEDPLEGELPPIEPGEEELSEPKLERLPEELRRFHDADETLEDAGDWLPPEEETAPADPEPELLPGEGGGTSLEDDEPAPDDEPELEAFGDWLDAEEGGSGGGPLEPPLKLELPGGPGGNQLEDPFPHPSGLALPDIHLSPRLELKEWNAGTRSGTPEASQAIIHCQARSSLPRSNW